MGMSKTPSLSKNRFLRFYKMSPHPGCGGIFFYVFPINQDDFNHLIKYFV